MSTDAEIIRSMVQAGVPRSCWAVSTRQTGRMHIRAYAEEAKGASEDKELQTVAVVKKAGPNDLLQVELVAKELVIAGVQTKYITFHHLARELRLDEAGREVDIVPIYGRGAFVLPSLPAPVEEGAPAHQSFIETLEWLAGHVYSGGILAVGMPRTVHHISGYPAAFMRLLTENSKVFEVQ